MSRFLQDLRYGARLLTKSPGFTLVAALSLALGIGANTTIFTLINAVLLHPLPVEDPSQLVSVLTTDERNAANGAFGFLQTSPLNYQDYRDKNEVFSGLAAHQGIPLNISGGTGDPQQIFGEIVTGNFFDVLGAKPAVGRGFLPEEDKTPGREAGDACSATASGRSASAAIRRSSGGRLRSTARRSRSSASCPRDSRAPTRSARRRCGCPT